MRNSNSYSNSILPVQIKLLIAIMYLVPTLFYGAEIFVYCKVVFNAIARYIFSRGRYDRIAIFGNTIFDLSLKLWLDYRALIPLQRIIVTKDL